MENQRTLTKGVWMVILALLIFEFIVTGAFATFNNGKSRYSQPLGCNETATIQVTNAQDDESTTFQPPPVTYNYQTENHKFPATFPNNNYYQPVILNNPKQTYLGQGYYGNNEVTEDRVPTLSPMTNRLAQLHKSVTAYRNQITGNRFFEMDDSVKFSLFTRKNPSSRHTLQLYNKDSIINSDFNADKPTKLILHGFSEIGALGEWVTNLRDAYLSTSEANVIVADFSTFETFLLFWTNLPVFASKRIADMITFLELTTGTSRENFHLIARSWGTHVVGVTGRLLHSRVGRITGLEPEDRVYGAVLPDYRLMSTDAKFVDIIRVNGRRYFFHGSRFGLSSPTGHVDIYPNFSERNAKCTGSPGSYSRVGAGGTGAAYCHRGRGVSYFTESIKYPQSHPMCQCRSYIDYKSGNCYCNSENSNYFLGEYLRNQTRGVFQLTNSPSNSNPFRSLLFG